jgi:hypothetical protein
MVKMSGQGDRPYLRRCAESHDDIPKSVALEIEAMFRADFFDFATHRMFMKWRGGVAHQSAGEFGKFGSGHVTAGLRCSAFT